MQILGMRVDFCPNRDRSGRTRPDLAEPRSSLAEQMLKPVASGRCRASCARIWADFGRLSARFGPGSTNFGPESSNTGPGSTLKLDRPWSNLARIRPSLARKRPTVSRIGRFRPTLGHSEKRNANHLGTLLEQRGSRKIRPQPASHNSYLDGRRCHRRFLLGRIGIWGSHTDLAPHVHPTPSFERPNLAGLRATPPPFGLRVD